jgi:hypothetical protein
MTMKKLNVLVPSVLALFVASAAHAGATFDTPQGKLNIGGDVEYDVTASHQNADAVTDHQTASGRILLDVNGERVLANGNYAGFKLNPMWGQQGDDKGADDAWFGFGVKNDWGFKIGHFEAYDLSPAGQDTYTVGTEGYRANLARGRNDNGGQILLTKENGPTHFEVSTQFGDYDNGVNPTGTKSKDPVIARPVVAWTGDTVSFAVGAELNLIPDAYTNAAGDDLSDWTGYGATTSFKASDDLTFALRGAYKDDVDGSSYSVGPNMQYQNFFISYLNGKTKVDSTDVSTKLNEVYASYKIPGVMGLDNFDMYLGASYGTKKVGDNDTDKEYGSRVRFKYFF